MERCNEAARCGASSCRPDPRNRCDAAGWALQVLCAACWAALLVQGSSSAGAAGDAGAAAGSQHAAGALPPGVH